MTKTQYFTATTVDGYIADADNSLEWLFEVPRNGGSGAEGFGGFFAEVGAMAMGRTTYEWVYAHERLDEEPEKWRRWYGDTPCWVFTHGEPPVVPDADIRFVQGDVVALCQLPFDRSGPALTDRLPLVPWNLQKACPEPKISIL